jgi:membrane protein
MPNVGTRWSAMQRALGHDLWAVDAARVGLARRIGLHLLRLLVVAARAAQDGQLNLRAMGLVYTTLLSLVPLLAVTFSVLKAFGAQYQIRPLLDHALAPLGEERHAISDRIVEFVTNTQVGVLGAIGVAGLLYTAFLLMDRVEEALNHVWQVRRARALTRKLTDYLSMLLAGPVLVFAAFALIASVQAYWLVQHVLAATRLERLAPAVGTYLLPFLLLSAAFSLLYRLVPNTEVWARSALIGGALGAALWHMSGTAFAAFLSGSARYAAIYSGFAGVMVFLLWLYVAWLIVLIGAVVGYYHQYPRAYLGDRERHGALYREWIALALAAETTRRFLRSEPPVRLPEVARAIGAPLTHLQPVVDDLVDRGILLVAVEPGGLALACPPDRVTVMDVLDIVRDPHAVDGPAVRDAGDPAADMLRRRDTAVHEALGRVTLRALVEASSAEAAVTELARYRAG